MEDMKDKSIHHTTLRLCEDLQQTPSYKSLYSDVQRLVSSPSVRYDDFKDSLTKSIKDSGLEVELRNSVYHWIRSRNRDEKSNSALESFFRKAQVQWDKRVHKSLNSMCSELGIQMARIRFASDRDELLEKWGELSNYDVEINKYRPVYAPKDFLEVLLCLRSPDYKRKPKEPKWEFSHIPLRVRDLQDLVSFFGTRVWNIPFRILQRVLFTELSRGEPILGVNLPTYTLSNYAAFEEERTLLGEKVLGTNHAPIAQEYLKRGCPRCLRARMWTIILGAEVRPSHYNHYDNLKTHVLQYDLMIDKLIIKDIHLTASNDDQYFVFEDVLHQIMLCFSRDSEVLERLSGKTGYMQVILKGKNSIPDSTLVFPPSGVIPFHGFTMYAAPFCYLYDDPVALYFSFRAFYLRYWYRLHRVCGHPQGIVSLCLLYERLLQSYEPTLWHHFRKLHIAPIRVAFKWIMKAFSGHLPPEQLLYLWDLILAYDSLEVIPLLSVTILIYRKDNLLRSKNLQNIEAVLGDLSSISVMSLLQMALLKE